MKISAYRLHEGTVAMQPSAIVQDRILVKAVAQYDLAQSLPDDSGWQLCCSRSFSATWNGGPDAADIDIRFADEPLEDKQLESSDFVQSSSGGKLTFHSGYQFDTDTEALLWVRGPSNQPKDGLVPLEQFFGISTLPCTLSIDWQFTRPYQTVRFDEGEAFCTVVPDPKRILIETTNVEIEPSIEDEATLLARKDRFREIAQALYFSSFKYVGPPSRPCAYSVIIPTLNEGARLWFTIHSMILAWEAQGDVDHEIIVVDSGSHDATVDFLQDPVMQKYVRLIQTNASGPGPVRQAGVAVAGGEVLFFMDAHVLVPPTFFVDTLAAMKKPHIWERVGAMHFPISVKGGLTDARCTHYKLTLARDFWGIQSNGAFPIQPEPLEIAVSSHATVAVRKAHFDAVGGYNVHQARYGGDETYLDLKFARFGYRNYLYNNTHVAHCTMREVCCPYGYDTLFHNNVISAYALGGATWGEQLLAHQLTQTTMTAEVIEQTYAKAITLAQSDYEFIQENALHTLEDVLQDFAVRNIPH